MAADHAAPGLAVPPASPPNPEPAHAAAPASPTQAKRKLDHAALPADDGPPRKKGQAPIKSAFLLDPSAPDSRPADADSVDPRDQPKNADQQQKGKRSKNKGQNTSRHFGSSNDAIRLCLSRATFDEFSHGECKFAEKCRLEHDLRLYLEKGKREDLRTFGGTCPVFEAQGTCPTGWKCRFAHAHSEEKTHPDGRKELVLLHKASDTPRTQDKSDEDEIGGPGIFNVIPVSKKIELRKKQVHTEKTDKYSEWLNKLSKSSEKGDGSKTKENGADGSHDEEKKQDRRAEYVEEPFKPSEKRRLYYGPETPILAPLTTQGNLPFRRLCVDLGAQVTWSEMAMGGPLVQGEKNEWTLMKAHESELTPPTFSPKDHVSPFYDNARDLKFGAQIAGNKPWVALKTTEIVTRLCPHLRAVDLNCGCPIDLVYRQGCGSALLDQPAKLEKILRGMNVVSGEVPITVKIRMGTRDNHPTADKLINRLAFGGRELRDLGLGPCGVAAITLHGRSRQQRYTRSADWEYISRCAALVKRYSQERADLTDTAAEPDPRDLANSERMYFVGNGDCYSYEDYDRHMEHAGVDSVMVARGALVKPWIFEEIGARQHLDKSATERLQYIENFCKYGLETWGSDEMGVGTTRRFLLEWLSFACRYIPIGLLEVMPPNIQDRPPAYRGRNELETLMSSDNYKDWIKISEMFLGKAAPGFKFEPKHKSNAYEETEG